jgi:hypothetical protein
MSIFDKLEVFVRCGAHPATMSPLGRQVADGDCDIIDETGAPVFPHTESAPGDQVSVEFGSHDVAMLLARDGRAGLVVIRIQVAEKAEGAAAEGAGR